MSPLFEELTRLARRYDDACRSALSCPRNREILRTKIMDLEEVVKTLQVRATAVELSAVDREQLRNNLEEMRRTRTELKTATDSADTVIADKATLQDTETLLVYTRFLIGLIENREASKKGENSGDADRLDQGRLDQGSHRFDQGSDDADPDHSCI